MSGVFSVAVIRVTGGWEVFNNTDMTRRRNI